MQDDVPEATANFETPFRIGHVLSRTLSAWLLNFIPFTLISAIAFSPLIAYTL